MDICSICLHSITKIIYRFEQCSTHIFCFNCFIAKNLIEDLKCSDCNRVLNMPSLANFSNICFYCQTQSTLLTCENNHKLCIDCVQNTETGVECYYCYITIFTYCSSCRCPLTLKTPIPEHPCHSKCSECFRTRTQNSDCLDCFEENSIKRNACRLCKKRSIAIKSCQRHDLCIQCCIILLMFKADNYKQIDCNLCITGFYSIDLANVCSVCGINNKDYIPIIACLKNHICCLKCFKRKDLIKNTACRDCRVYFKLKEKNKINCCVICYYDSSLFFKKMCRSHCICAKCSEKMFKFSIEIQQKLINCQECLNFYSQEYKIVAMNVNNYEKCFLCNKNSGLEIICPLHKFCKKCLMFEMINILGRIGDCTYCNNFNSKVCRMCLNVTNKPRSLKCPYEHIYCLSCIMQKDNFLKTDNEICSECSTYVVNESFMKNQRCIQCRIPMNPSSNCREHSICSECLLNNTNQTFKNCKKCKECLQLECSRCKKSRTNFLWLIECKAQHLYCESCFKDLKINCDIFCEDCLHLFRRTEPIKIKKYCSKCMTVEIAQFICNTHSYCLKCNANSESYVIDNSKMYSELNEKYCFNCHFELKDKYKLFFPTCDKNHFYCRSCFNKLRLTEPFKCNSCNIKGKKNDALCDLCFRREHKSKLCTHHSFCEICMINLKKEVGIDLKCLLVCSLCKEIIEKSRPIKTSDPLLNNHNQTPMPITKTSPSTEVNINRQNYPKSDYSQGPYFNIPINQESVYNYDKASSQQNYHNQKINPSKIQKEAGNNWILKEMSEHREVVKQTLTPQQDNPLIFHNQVNQNTILDFSQPIPSTNTDPNIYLQGSSNINDPKSISYANNPNAGVEFNIHPLAVKNDTFSNFISGLQQFTTKKKREVLCKKCNKNYPRLKCNHPECPLCLSNAFIKKFNLFINALDKKSIKSLKTIDYSISCPELNCNNKNCFPFDLFKSDAYSMVVPYFPYDLEKVQKFLIHYEGLFEGIEYTFMICQICQGFTGKASYQLCFWCDN